VSLIEYTFFSKRPKISGVQLYPLTAGRLIVLEQRGNPLAGAGTDDNPDPFALYEALMVASSDSEQLAEMCLLDDHDWKKEVRKFGFDVPDVVLTDFQKVIEDEMDAIKQSQVKPKKKAASAPRSRTKK
jgi:hypothetical protein